MLYCTCYENDQLGRIDCALYLRKREDLAKLIHSTRTKLLQQEKHAIEKFLKFALLVEVQYSLFTDYLLPHLIIIVFYDILV